MRRLLARLPLRLGEIVAVVVALSLGYVLSSHVQPLAQDQKPFVRAVARGHTAHLSYGDIRVLDVRTAKYLTPWVTDSPTIIASSVFVVAVLEVTATREPTTFSSIWLQDDEGNKYRPSSRSSCDSSVETDTGIPTYLMVCFEVPVAPLDELNLEASRGSDKSNDTRQDDVADIDLGIDPDDEATSADTDAAYQVAQSGQEPLELKPVAIQESS